MTAFYTSDIDCFARRMLSNANWLDTHPFDQALKLSTVKVPFAFVLNSDASHLPGSNWLAFYQESSTLPLKMFDSFGFLPSFYSLKNVYSFRILQYSTHRFQNIDSQVCGHYVLMFLIYRSIGYSYIDFINYLLSFKCLSTSVDSIVLNSARNIATMYKLVEPCIKSKLIHEQCCISKICFACKSQTIDN